jgi:hypothetical protein
VAALLGCFIGFSPLIVERASQSSRLAHFSSDAAAVLSYPGYVVALGIARGRFHDIDLKTIVIANIVIYFCAIYFVPAVLQKFKK